MAEGLLKRSLKYLGKGNIEVQSAGVGAIDGMAPTRETIEVMRREGIDVSALRSKALTEKIILDADLILVMAAHHMDDVIRMVPEAVSKTHLLKQLASSGDTYACEEMDIRDPIGRSVEFYENILGEIKKEIKRIAELL